MPAVDTNIPLYIGVDTPNTVTVLNDGNQSVYYQADTTGGTTISSTTNDGTLTAGSTLTLTVSTYFLAAAAGASVAITRNPGKTAAYTLTYSTAARTVPNATYAAPTVTAVATAATAATSTSPFGYAQAQADAIRAGVNATIIDVAATNTKLAALAADVLALKKLIVALVSDLETAQIAG